MKKILLVFAVFLTGFLQVTGNDNINYQEPTKEFSINAVNLITDREIEIVCDKRPADAQEVYDRFVVAVDGTQVEYTYLSYFNFGKYANAPVINIRLNNPLNVGTLRGKTGTTRTPGENTQTVLGPRAAATLQVRLGNQTVNAIWTPFYDYMNIGSKSKLTATGTASCGTLATNDEHLGIAYSNEHVVDYAAGGLHRMTGRAEMITQNAVDYGVAIMIVGADQSVYEAPQWRELFNPADYKTRRIIEGTLEKPVIVTTADDVMRQQSAGEMLRPKSDFFYLGEAFARMFWRVGVDGSENGATSGCRRVPRSVYNDPDDYRYDKYMIAAYEEAKRKKMYPNTKMMNSVEDYFVYGTMIFYEFLPESSDGQWTNEGGPVNTREELKRYDHALYRPLCGIYGEWEYFSSENNTGFDNGRDGVRSAMPWFWHTQVDNYDITTQAYPVLDIEHVWVIAENQIEIKFNREVKDMNALYHVDNWKIQHSADGGSTWNDVSHVMAGGYLWQAITLQLPQGSTFRFTMGSFGRSFRGFTKEDINERNLSAGGWIDNDQTESPTALKLGQYVDVNEAINTYGAGINGMFRLYYTGDSPIRDWAGNQLSVTKAYEATFNPWVGNVYRSPLTGVYIYGDTKIPKDVLIVSGMYYDLQFTNNLYKEYDQWPSGVTYTTTEMLSSAMYDRPGQRIADFATRQNGGMLIVGEGQHPNQQPERRGQQAGNYHGGLYVEGWGGNIFQDQANNITRDYSMTRYKNEFLLYHEGGHGIDSYTGPNSYAPWVYTNISAAHDMARSEANGRRYYDENDVGAYLSSRGEYVSTGSTYWHGCMRESKDGTNDGTWTPVSNRWEFYRYDPWGFEAFKRLFFSNDLGLWYENKVGDPHYRVLPGDWKYLQNDLELNRYLTLHSGLSGNGETVRIDSENALIAWGCTVFESLRDDLWNDYHNPLINWVSWSTPMIYDITVKQSTNPEFPNNNMGFLGGVLYYPETVEPKSFLNPFLRPGGVKKPDRTPEDEAVLYPISGIAGNLTLKTPVLPVFNFSNAAQITVDNAQTSFAVKVNGKKLGFRFFKHDDQTVTLYLNWPVDENDLVEITVLTTGQKIHNEPIKVETQLTAEEEAFLALLDYQNVDRLAHYLTKEIGNRYTSTFRRDMAVDWIMSELKSYGYEPSIHEFENNRYTNNGCFEVDGRKYIYYGPVYDAETVYQFTNNTVTVAEMECLNWTDVNSDFIIPGGVDVAGKAVIVTLTSVQTANSSAAVVPNAINYYNACLTLQDAGAKAVIFELPAPRNDMNTSYARIPNTSSGTSVTIPVGATLHDETHSILNNLQNVREIKLTMETRRDGKNVLSLLPSATGSKKNVYVSAHFDTTVSGPGMNDNGSGTAMVLEMARAFKNAKFEYNIVFFLCDAEEAGLRGARAYCLDMTDEERANFVADYNMDMIATSQEDCVHFFLNINDTTEANASRLRTIQNSLTNDRRLIEVPEAYTLAKQRDVFNHTYLAAQKLAFDMNFFNICWDTTTDHWAFVQEATRAVNHFPNMMNAVEYDWRCNQKGTSFEALYHKVGDTYEINLLGITPHNFLSTTPLPVPGLGVERMKKVGDMVSLAIFFSAKGSMLNQQSK